MSEMAQAIGLSNLYPAVPIMNFLAMVLLLLLMPSFWKTRIVALVALLGWLFLVNFLFFIGIIHWRGHTNDAPVLASILSILWRAWICGFPTSSACFAHFTWQRLQPFCARRLYDTRRRNNLIHFFFTLILPLLWVPLCRSLLLPGAIHHSGGFWTSPRYTVRLARLRDPSTAFVSKLCDCCNVQCPYPGELLANGTEEHRLQHPGASPICEDPKASPHGGYKHATCHVRHLQSDHLYDKIRTGPATSMAENIASLQIVFESVRSDLDTAFTDDATGPMKVAIIMPLLAFYVFAWFGCGEEARKAYGEALLKLGRLVGVVPREHWPRVSTLRSPWSATASWKAGFRQELVDALSLDSPNAPQITPYPSSILPPDGPEPPASHVRTAPSYSAGNRVDVKRQGVVPSRDPVGRLSLHKPPLAAVNPANAILSILDVPLRRLSHHKPSFVSSAPPNGPVIATPHASGSNPPNVEAANNTRRQEKFASRPRARRLLYHKPAFVPLAPANSNGAVPKASGPIIPLAGVPRYVIGKRNNVLQAESSVEDRMVPPSFSTTSMAPPHFQHHQPRHLPRRIEM